MLVMSTITLCLAKPSWVWPREKNSGEKLNDEKSTRKVQNDEKNIKQEWKKGHVSKARTSCMHGLPTLHRLEHLTKKKNILL